MLKVENLTFGYRKKTPPVLQNINMELEKGQIGVLLGKNGSGKTTLLKNILCLLKSEQGEITFDGKDLKKMSSKERAGTIAYVPQEIQFGDLSVFDSILIGRVSSFGFRASKTDYEITEQVIQDMGMEALAHRKVNTLSGGEKQKVAIARAMVQSPGLMIFDEPTGNLDLENEQKIMREVKKISRQKNIAILCTLHDLNQAMNFGDRFFFLKEGKICSSGGKECFTEEGIEAVFGAKVQIASFEDKKIVIGDYDYE